VKTRLSTPVAETIRQTLTPFLDSEMGNAATDPEDLLEVWFDQVWDVLTDREPPEDRLFRRLCRQDWTAIIARYRPDALPRLEADRLRQARRETLLSELQTRLAAYPDADAGERADAVHRAVAWALRIAGESSPCRPRRFVRRPCTMRRPAHRELRFSRRSRACAPWRRRRCWPAGRVSLRPEVCGRAGTTVPGGRLHRRIGRVRRGAADSG
jgi:hypothetical protein